MGLGFSDYYIQAIVSRMALGGLLLRCLHPLITKTMSFQSQVYKSLRPVITKTIGFAIM